MKYKIRVFLIISNYNMLYLSKGLFLHLMLVILMNYNIARGKKYFAFFLLTLCFAGCAGFGPTTVSRDRFDYTEAISDSWKHQMLLNMIKMRYGDAPVFLDVSSVISQYQIAGQINLGATINNNPWSTSEILGATGQYYDRPTITYSGVEP